MTAAEAIERLSSLRGGDPEDDHGEADRVLLQVLRSHGLANVADAWESACDRVGFWYA